MTWYIIITAIFLIIFIILLLKYTQTKNEKNNIELKYQETLRENEYLKTDYEKLKNSNTQISIQLSAIQEKSNILEKELSENKNIIHDLNTDNTKLNSENATYIEKIKNLEHLIQTQKQEFQDIQKQLQKEFELISSRLLEQNTQKLTEQNQQILHHSIQPVKDYLAQVKEMEQKIQRYYDNENKERSSLKTIVEALTKKSDDVKQTAEKLANALTSQVKQQGNWGELILEKILELSELQQGREYITQQKENDKQPDITICLPSDRYIIIDSKVTLNSYVAYQSSNNEEEQSKHVSEIIKSIVSHYENLSKKEYEKIYALNSVDFVLMFVPIETVMTIVQQHKPEIFNDAFRKRVLIVTPTSLMSTLKTIYHVWQQEKRKKEFESILSDIEKLYDKLRVFTEHFSKIETALNAAQHSFDDAKKSLIAGKGNALGIIENKIKPYINPKESITKYLPENDEN